MKGMRLRGGGAFVLVKEVHRLSGTRENSKAEGSSSPTVLLEKFDQGGGGDDAGRFMTFQAEQRFVSGDEEISFTGLSEDKQVIVAGIGRAIDLREFLDEDGEVAKPVDQASGERRRQSSPNFGVAGDTRDFVELLGSGEEVELTAAPECEDLRRRRSRRHQSGEEHVGVED
jgi:hypothetical protein